MVISNALRARFESSLFKRCAGDDDDHDDEDDDDADADEDADEDADDDAEDDEDVDGIAAASICFNKRVRSASNDDNLLFIDSNWGESWRSISRNNAV